VVTASEPSAQDVTASAAAVRRAAPSTLRVALIAGVVATIGALAFVALRVSTFVIDPVADQRDQHIFVSTYDPPQNNLEGVIDFEDGQAWAALARDPTLSHPEVFHDGTKEFVYRAQRPLFGWLVWAASFGQPDLVAGAEVAMTCLGIGFLAATSVLLADRLGRVRRYGALTVLLPGSLLVGLILGPEPLAVGFAVLGVYWWLGSPRRLGLAVVMFTLGVLCRDTLLLVPVAVGACDLVYRRRPLREIAPLAVAPITYAAWVVSLRVRFGYWPTQADASSRLGPPFVGWFHAIPHLDALSAASFVLGAVLVVIAIRRDRSSPLTWCVAAGALSTIFYGTDVLATESYRPLLALYVFGVIMALPAARRGAGTRKPARV
jgi:hypothetical protein